MSDGARGSRSGGLVRLAAVLVLVAGGARPAVANVPAHRTGSQPGGPASRGASRARASVDTIALYGPHQFQTPNGAPTYNVERFTVQLDNARQYALRIQVGDGAGGSRPDSAAVLLNGSRVATSADLRGQDVVTKVVQPAGSNTLEVTVGGASGAYVSVSLLAEPDPTFNVFGPKTYLRGYGTPDTDDESFALPAAAGPPYRVVIVNGRPDGTNRVSSASILLNGQTILTSSDLNQNVAGLVREVAASGSNTLQLTLKGNPEGEISFRVTALDTAAPRLTLTAPAANLVTRDTLLTVTGSVQDVTPTSVTVNGTPAAISGGTFSAAVPLTVDGPLDIVVVATDAAGNRTTVTTPVVRDRTPPVLTVASPTDGLATRLSPVRISGSVTDATAVAVKANDTILTVAADGSFTGQLPLVDGPNVLTITATDAAGNATSVVRQVALDTVPPTLTLSAPDENAVTREASIAVQGHATDASLLRLTVNGVLATLGPDGAFSTVVALAVGADTIGVVATDTAGNATTLVRHVVRDTTPPSLTLTLPVDGSYTRLDTATVSGRATDQTAVTVTAAGRLVRLNPDGTFSEARPLVEGANPIPVVATDAAGNATSLTRTVTRDTTPPVLTLSSPAENAVIGGDSTLVSGQATDANALTVTANGVVLPLAPDGSFSARVAVAADASVTVVARDTATNTVQAIRHLVRDTVPPLLIVSQPADGSFTRADSATVAGTVADATPTTVTVNGFPLPVDAAGAFSGRVALSVGPNPLLVTAIDAGGNRATGTRTVTRDTVKPTLTVSSPTDGSTVATDHVTVSGTATDAFGVRVTVNGGAAPVSAGGSFSRDVALSAGPNTIAVVATDSATNTTQVTVHVTRQDVVLPPDPATVAPAIDPTVATSMSAATSFLYSGSNPIQTGVAAGTIDPIRVGVVRGRVLGTNGQPLSGVKVIVADHPELGSTLSRADGFYDLAINAGGTLTLDYGKSGYLPAQRPVSPQWREFEVLKDVVLTAFDTAVTAIDLSQPLQIARASVVSDSSGTRQEVLAFPQGATATMHMPDGSTQLLTTLHVRATEVTVGNLGQRAMPAPLPPTTAYMYAAEYSVDEAVAAGATGVDFSAPVSAYVDNFLGFPVGTNLPTGYYDHQRHVWVPVENGKVIKILSVDGGVASLDTDGDGAADDAGELAALGISDAELRGLARTYPAGKTIWRNQLAHFSLLDRNNGQTPEAGAEAPKTEDPHGDEKETPDPDCRDGSDIWCERQVLGEQLSIVGSPFALGYSSDRVPGRKSGYSVKIPLSDASIPSVAKAIELEVEVAGKTTELRFPPLPNQSFTFTWDGMDAYGRVLQGRQPVHVRISYAYRAVYVDPGQRAKAFAQYGGTPIGVNARGEAVLSREWRGLLGPWDARGQGLGGWTLSAHHAYDPSGRVLYYGDGPKRTVDAAAPVVKTVAGNGTFGYAEGQPATQSPLMGPVAVAPAPDGSLYIVDQMRIRKVGTDGIVRTYAGNGQQGFAGDGGPAINAKFNNPSSLALGPDGSLYIADQDNNRVRRVGPDGIISTFAGGTSTGFAGDGGPANQALLNTPRGIAVGPDGSLFIADWVNARVRRVGTDGIINTIAGTTGCPGVDFNPGPVLSKCMESITAVAVAPDGTFYFNDSAWNIVWKVTTDGYRTLFAGIPSRVGGYTGDGGYATNARIGGANGLSVGPDGSFLIADQGGSRIRRVGLDGIITTVAGAPGGSETPDGNVALRTVMNAPKGYAFGPDGSAYFASTNSYRVRKLGPPLPGFSVGEMSIPSESGAEVYVFDAMGRHLRTLDGLTGLTRLTFGYDGSGRLASITDLNRLSTRVERDGAGNATAVVGPHGERTALTLDANGYLASLTNPAGEQVRLAYNADGLLKQLTDARQGLHTFAYDSLGRLTRDDDPAGGFTTLARVDSTGVSTITVADAAGRPTSYRIDTPPGTLSRETTTDALGRRVVRTEAADGTVTTVLANGMTSTLLQVQDPRFGMAASYSTNEKWTTPAGLTNTVTRLRSVALADPSNLWSFSTLSESVSVNGRLTTTTLDRTSRRVVRTSPEGRQRISVLDSQGRMVLDSVPGLLGVHYTYDADGRLSALGAGSLITNVNYDSDGRPATLTDATGHTESYGYDAAGRLSRHVLPDSTGVELAYDSAGNLTSLLITGRAPITLGYSAVDLLSHFAPAPSSADERPLRFSYNGDRTLATASRPGGATVQLRYDGAGALASAGYSQDERTYTYLPSTGLLTRLGNMSEQLTYTYDGILLTNTTWIGAVAGSLGIAYDSLFRPASFAVNAASAVSYTYDRDGLLTKAGGLSLLRDAQNGLIRGSTLGGITTSVSYDSLGLPRIFSASYAGQVLFSRTYARDALGRIAAVMDRVQADSTALAYGYDVRGRLATVAKNGVVVASYDYDRLGNRTRLATPEGIAVGTYDGQERLLTYGEVAFGHDLDGNRTRRVLGSDSTLYTYDDLGQLVSAILPSGNVATYVYDGRGRRIVHAVNGVVARKWLYFDQTHPAAEMDASNNVTSTFVYAGNANAPAYMVKGGTTYRIIADQLGSVRLVVDVATGEVKQRLDYDEFGRVTRNTNPGFQPFGFAGGIMDDETNLVHFGARDYDPATARFIQKDPLSLAGGLNLYQYANGDPVNSSDAFGLIVCFRGDKEEVQRLVGLAERATYTHITLDSNNCVARADPTNNSPEAAILQWEFNALMAAAEVYTIQPVYGGGSDYDPGYQNPQKRSVNIDFDGSYDMNMSYPVMHNGKCGGGGAGSGISWAGLMAHELGHAYVHRRGGSYRNEDVADAYQNLYASHSAEKLPCRCAYSF